MSKILPFLFNCCEGALPHRSKPGAKSGRGAGRALPCQINPLEPSKGAGIRQGWWPRPAQSPASSGKAPVMGQVPEGAVGDGRQVQAGHRLWCSSGKGHGWGSGHGCSSQENGSCKATPVILLALSALTLPQQCEPSQAAEPGHCSQPGRMGAQQQSWNEFFLHHWEVLFYYLKSFLGSILHYRQSLWVPNRALWVPEHEASSLNKL